LKPTSLTCTGAAKVMQNESKMAMTKIQGTPAAALA